MTKLLLVQAVQKLLLIEAVKMSAEIKKPADGSFDSKSHAEVFQVLDSKERNKVVKMVKQEGVSLGMVDPTTGR